MIKFKDRPIKSKLTIFIMISTFLAMFALSSLFVYQQYNTYKKQLSEEITTITKIIADRSNAAILFADQQTLRETLSSLALHKYILLGCTYSAEGHLLAKYLKPKSQLACPININSSIHSFIQNDFQVSEPIILDGNEEGLVYIRTSTEQLKSSIKATLLNILLLSSLIILAALLFARYIQRFISTPLVQLQKVAHKVTEDHDFSFRVRKKNNDEIGELVEAFNTMLETISEQNKVIEENTNNLETKVHERTEELAIANRELEAFSYSVSHDLKAPLRIIEGFSRALEEDYGDQLDETAQDYLTRVRVGSFKMSQLITNLLQLSKVTRQELSKEKIDFSKLTNKIAKSIIDQDNERTTHISIQENMTAMGDTNLVEILLDNLIGNAWKYSRKNPEARIEVGMREHLGTNIYYVRDFGSGFDMKYADQLFKPFNRLHSPEEFEGTGIGLATVSRIIERHHGKVWAESDPNTGTVFFFTLFPGSSNSSLPHGDISQDTDIIKFIQKG